MQAKRTIGSVPDAISFFLQFFVAFDDFVDLVAGDNVQRDRLIQLLRTGPEGIVNLVLIGRPFAPCIAIDDAALIDTDVFNTREEVLRLLAVEFLDDVRHGVAVFSAQRLGPKFGRLDYVRIAGNDRS